MNEIIMEVKRYEADAWDSLNYTEQMFGRDSMAYVMRRSRWCAFHDVMQLFNARFEELQSVEKLTAITSLILDREDNLYRVYGYAKRVHGKESREALIARHEWVSVYELMEDVSKIKEGK